MKNKLIVIIAFIIGASMTFNCSKNSLTDELDDGPIPDDYPQLEEGTNGIVSMIANNGDDLIDKKVIFKDPKGVYWSAGLGRYNIYIINASGTKAADLQMKDIKKGTYTSDDTKNGLIILINNTYYIRSTYDETCYFNINIVGNNGKEIWGTFEGKLKKGTVYLDITEGKFSAKIEE